MVHHERSSKIERGRGVGGSVGDVSCDFDQRHNFLLVHPYSNFLPNIRDDQLSLQQTFAVSWFFFINLFFWIVKNLCHKVGCR